MSVCGRCGGAVPFGVTLCDACVDAQFNQAVDDITRITSTRTTMPDGRARVVSTNAAGQYHDDGIHPAVREFYADGSLAYAGHYLDGVATNVDRQPAHVWYHLGQRPSVIHRMKSGVLHDYRNSAGALLPAVVWLDSSGYVIRAESWRDGEFCSILD